MPEVAMLYKISELFNCSVDAILTPVANTISSTRFSDWKRGEIASIARESDSLTKEESKDKKKL